MIVSKIGVVDKATIPSTVLSRKVTRDIINYYLIIINYYNIDNILYHIITFSSPLPNQMILMYEEKCRKHLKIYSFIY